jgi:hypothetical protein
MPTVAVDFDGVIHAYSKGWHDGTIYDAPIPGALEGISTLQGQGFAVYVFTSRDPMAVATWLVQHGVRARVDFPWSGAYPFEFWNSTTEILVSNRKLPAVVYLDDRAVRFEGDWTQALLDVRGAAS